MVQALQDIKVIDIATLFAVPMAATMLGDFGAEVIKVEHPKMGIPLDRMVQVKMGLAFGGKCWRVIRNL